MSPLHKVDYKNRGLTPNHTRGSKNSEGKMNCIGLLHGQNALLHLPTGVHSKERDETNAPQIQNMRYEEDERYTGRQSLSSLLLPDVSCIRA